MRRHATTFFICSVLVLGLGTAGQLQERQQEHQHAPAAPAGDMAAHCKAMMEGHQKMMAEMETADRRLDELVSKMNSASGEAKVNATAAAVSELASQRKAMHQRMMQMHQGTMGHMMQHMQAGPSSVAMCPMMKMGGMKH
jgi:hypothetical protein